MAPNKRGGPLTQNPDDGGVLGKDEIEARGSGTQDHGDTYDSDRFLFSEVRTFFTCVMFLTRLPCPTFTDHHPAFLMRSMLYFPACGLVIGAWAGVWHAAAAALWGTHIAAVVSTLSTVWLTGCFHEDGLADTFDGFGGGWGRAQILRIMKDSRVGTYGAVGTTLVMLLKALALGAIDAREARTALVLGHTLSRWVSLPLLFWSHYIQDDEDAKRGMYNWFAQCQRLLTPMRLALATVFTAAVACALARDAATAGAMCALCATIVLLAWRYAHFVIGGVVGDYLGATIAISEVSLYLLLAADWQGALNDGLLGKVGVLGGTALLPVLYCRRIIDYNASC